MKQRKPKIRVNFSESLQNNNGKRMHTYPQKAMSDRSKASSDEFNNIEAKNDKKEVTKHCST